MKIDRVQLGEALLAFVLREYQYVPQENAIDCTFSQKFQENIRFISKKSESVAWRVWQAPLKRAILIAVLVMIMLVTIACATPSIRKAMIDFFFVGNGESYGITFDPEAAAKAPRSVEQFYAPTYDPEGYILIHKDCSPAGADLIWMNESDEYIHYMQSPIPENVTSETWIGIDAEGTSQTSQIVNGYLVEIISSEADQQFVAVWTDNRYIYTLDISCADPNPEALLEAIMVSLVEVDTVN